MSACGGGTIGYMWVLGQQYNQITGFKVDDFTGNLTQVIGSPFSANGVNPVSILVKPGGRYVYVINQGTGGGVSTRDPLTKNPVVNKEKSGGIAVYSVGGDGVLAFQQSYATQGSIPTWAQFDSGGTYLYVLDKFSPDPDAVNTSGAHVGSITVFTVDASTGRLNLVTNQQEKDTTGNPKTYFNVGAAPIMMKTAGGCLFTLDGDNSVFPYSFGTSGQITVTTTGFFPTGATSLTSINGSGSNIFLTDAGSNRILPYTVGGPCALTSLAGGSVANASNTSNPQYSMVDNSGKYLYVLNQSTTNTSTGSVPFSSITAFTLSATNGQLTQIPGSPYPVGSNPVCMVEDTSNQYVYTSNRNDGTVTGLIINTTTGELRGLTRGSTFPASGIGSCLALSGNVN
jgi:6-phosphogluconolactonase (cycloisomerase 2 family)